MATCFSLLQGLYLDKPPRRSNGRTSHLGGLMVGQATSVV